MFHSLIHHEDKVFTKGVGGSGDIELKRTKILLSL
jgi:hypothetical protein